MTLRPFSVLRCHGVIGTRPLNLGSLLYDVLPNVVYSFRPREVRKRPGFYSRTHPISVLKLCDLLERGSDLMTSVGENPNEADQSVLFSHDSVNLPPKEYRTCQGLCQGGSPTSFPSVNFQVLLNPAETGHVEGCRARHAEGGQGSGDLLGGQGWKQCLLLRPFAK